jgi:Sec-independent protein translocase protein TatA
MADDRRTQHVTLGCGTLILIALIVSIFSGRPGLEDLGREVRGLRSDIGELKKTIEAQSAQIKALHDRTEKAKGT